MTERISTPRSALVDALVSAQHCDCGNRGWYVVTGRGGEPEQQQCEFCYTTPNSMFNVVEKVKAYLSASSEKRPCTCAPEDVPGPCQHKYAASECIAAARSATRTNNDGGESRARPSREESGSTPDATVTSAPSDKSSRITDEELALILGDLKGAWSALAEVAMQLPGAREHIGPRSAIPVVIDMVFEQASASSAIAPPRDELMNAKLDAIGFCLMGTAWPDRYRGLLPVATTDGGASWRSPLAPL